MVGGSPTLHWLMFQLPILNASQRNTVTIVPIGFKRRPTCVLKDPQFRRSDRDHYDELQESRELIDTTGLGQFHDYLERYRNAALRRSILIAVKAKRRQGAISIDIR
jgi:hypothetical protein